MPNTKGEIFNWQDYLDSNNSIDVPENLFKHVEQSLDTGISCGMAVEIPYKSSDENTHYWPAIITKICGPMITLQYLGAEDKNKNCDIWSDIASLRNIGYAKSIGVPLTAPSCLLPLSKHLDGEEALQKAIRNLTAVPLHVLEEEGKSAVHRISNGMVVGVRDILDPKTVRNAEIMNHVGGRLLLKMLTEPHDYFWLFYTDYRIVEAEIDNGSIKFPVDLLVKHPKIEPHSFEIGMQLEMLNPKTRASVQNGVVCEIIDNKFFLASVVDKNGAYDTEKTPYNTWLCSLDHPYIFPVGWASKNNLHVTQTNDIDSERCTYKEMFSSRPNAQALGFDVGMKLEAVHPNNENAICVATIKSIHEHLLCITFDHEVQNQLMKSYYVHCCSNEIFPIYWCGTNDYELVHPITEQQANIISIKEDTCPIIYFNYKCRTGPMYSHKKIAQLPVSVGPGVVSLVLKKVLNLIVSEAYQPLRILKSLECDGKPRAGRTLVEIKASTYNNVKEKVTVRANVDVVTSPEQVAEYCQEVCKIIQACPYLFGPQNTGDRCPENCTGDKNVNSNDKANKIGPKYKKKGKRGLHLKALHARRLARQSELSKESEDSEGARISDIGSRPTTPVSVDEASLELSKAVDNSNSSTPTKKKEIKRRKRKHANSPPPQIYEMKTRGAKLPNFAIQMKRGHWDKKDVETLYKQTLRIPKKKPRFEYITESESDPSDNETNLNSNDNETNSKSFISDISNSDISRNGDTNFNEISFNSIDSVIDIKEENMEEENLEEENLEIENLEEENLEEENLYEENLGENLEEENLDEENLEEENLEEENMEEENFEEKLEEVMSLNGSLSSIADGNPSRSSNPLHWTVDDLQNYLKNTSCQDLAERLKEELIDGQAFMLLNSSSIQEFLNLRLDLAERLCDHVSKVKRAFFVENVR